jgi:hypothetical protein
MNRTTRVVLLLAFAIAAAARFAHLDLVWIEEAYGSAAASQMLAGKFLYRDIWFDKPPLYALTYLIWDAQPGAPLRWYGFLYVALAAALLYRFAHDLWGKNEAVIAAVLTLIYLTFGIPSAVMALAPDLLMVVPHIAAVYLAWKQKPFWSGFIAGIAFLVNAKGALVLVACAFFCPRLSMAAGFAAPNAFFVAVLLANGAFRSYWEQVWTWGALYSSAGFNSREGLVRTLNWVGFHATAVAGAALAPRDRRFAVWVLLSAVAVTLGWRFFPRYYFQLLVPCVLLASRGVMTLRPAYRIALLALLLVPVVRFGPRYVTLAGGDRSWSDLAMMQDSRRVGEMLKDEGGSLLVWGYRPDVYVFSGLPAGTPFVDSQPLTGALADRHLTNPAIYAPELAARNRKLLAAMKPDWIVDGLGPYRPELAITRFDDLRPWLSGYREAGRTRGSIIYRRVP